VRRTEHRDTGVVVRVRWCSGCKVRWRTYEMRYEFDEVQEFSGW
jgi:transcriptional regulator NrdR family protein